jgi:3-hydroxybutyryl-CoA dehydrogenase
MKINNIAVIGAGLMGSGIAQVCAQAGYRVNLNDIKEEFIDKGLSGIHKNLDKMVGKGKLDSGEAEQIQSRITTSTSLKDSAGEADVVIEAVIEKMDLKKDVYTQLDDICKDHTIFATNTSGLSITEMASITKRPENFIGMHFFNPVPVMKLVEIIRGYSTSDETVAAIKELTQNLGKTGIEVKEAPGFVVNRILVPMITEAIFALQDGLATAEEIDEGMKLGANHPLGPLALADMVGLDTLLNVQQHLYDEFGDSKYRVPGLLKKMVRAGTLGRKTGKGFYDYT